MLWVVCLALLSDTVGQNGIGQAVGIIGIPMSVGPIIGPLLGGVIYAYGGYFAVFGLMFGLLAIDAVLRLLLVEKKVARKWLESGQNTQPEAAVPSADNKDEAVSPVPESVDTCETPTVPRVDNDGTQAPSSQNSKTSRRLPAVFRLLLNPRITVGIIGGLLQSALNVAFDSTLPLVVEDIFGWNQTGQGLIFITILIPSLLQPVFGRITDKYQQGRRLLGAGGCLLATPFYVLLRLVTHDSIGQKVLLCVLLVIIGLAMAISMPAIIAEIGTAVEDQEKEDPQAVKGGVVATGWSLVNAAYAAGCLIGPLFAGLIRNAAGWQTTTWCLGLLSGVTGVFVLLFLDGWIGKRTPKALIAKAAKEGSG
ncbi:uncharacterized protein E0L32_006877 [Thyridium curvatum]|uniref:Major facilitator superfamily (MFS) profile domain-containing protein n=1 Tax=Thyridium curvatum TaxID=1093900 RepID=A0A507ANQ7_9PEZI|nr:uncharacterized protein E0L32_006877 [Thyridium curvatum]TPX12465.1 hypothetical protein E0L32_006877 [Thyridium curvatum]